MIRFLLSCVVVSGFGLSASPAADPPLKTCDVGVAGEMFKDIPPALINVVGKPFRELIRNDTGVGGDFKVFPNCQTLSKHLDENTCQLGVYHGYEFAWEKEKNGDLVPLVVTEYHTGRPQACVVVHKDSTAAKLTDLKAEEIAIPKGTRGHCIIYVERFGKRAEPTKALERGKLAPTQALDDVVKGDIPAAVVDVSALNGYEKLYPGAFKNLRIISKSEQFPQNVIAYKKGTISNELAAKLRATLVDAHTTPAGKPLMILWNMKNFAEIPAQYEKQLRDCHKTYPPPADQKAAAGGQ